MTHRKKFLASLTGTVVFLFLIMVFVTAAVHRAGTVAIEVREEGGDNISLKIPGAIFQVALALTPKTTFSCDADDDVDVWFDVVRIVSREMTRMPDATFVEVDGDGGEHVTVTKKGPNLLIDVRDGSDRVHISVPFSIVKTAAGKFQPRPKKDLL